MTARTTALVCFSALLILQPIWHVLLAPPTHLPVGVALGIALLPLLGVGLMLMRGQPSGLFWAGVISLFYLCYGVMEAWTVADTRLLGTLQTLFAIGLVLAVGYDGLQRRRASRARQSAGNHL